MDPLPRLDAVVDRLVHKMEMSQTPVPGFIVGLSGTDSLVAFEVLARGLKRLGKPDRLVGVHYADRRMRPGAFARDAVPWLERRFAEARIVVAEPLGGNHDPQRWADLQLRALNQIQVVDGRVHAMPHAEGMNYWTSGTINATEHALGKHSIGANAVSIQPIRSLWKTDVMRICEAIGVPSAIIANARLPDCLCGRDEIAARHIEIIDDILRHQVDVRAHDPELMMTLMQWIADRKRGEGFHARIPYVV